MIVLAKIVRFHFLNLTIFAKKFEYFWIYQGKFCSLTLIYFPLNKLKVLQADIKCLIVILSSKY